MSLNIELYRGPERKFFGTMPFLDVVRQSFQQFFGWDPREFQFKITIVNVPHESTLVGTPLVENLVPEYGFVYLTLHRDGIVAYQHPHPLDDFVTRKLQELLRQQYPDEIHWAFRLDVPGMPAASFDRQAPMVKGGVLVGPDDSAKRPSFGIQRVPEPPLPIKTLADYGITPRDDQRSAAVKVMVPKSLATEQLAQRPFSEQV